jgi:hypothetical protein
LAGRERARSSGRGAAWTAKLWRGNADSEHKLRRGSTDGGADCDGVVEFQRRRERARNVRKRERESSERKKARLWEGEERSSAIFIERGRGEEEMAGVMPLMAFKELEWREKRTQ